MSKKIRQTLCLLGGVFLFGSAVAKDYGTYGQTYPVAERSFIEAIQEKMQGMVDNGEWDKYKEKYIDETMNSLKRPKGITLPHVLTSQVRYVDPSIILEIDIPLADGRFLARRGDRINPLENTNITRPMAFIDGDEPKQVQWALQKRKENPRTTIILVSGNWYELSVKNKTKFWFDQTGEFVSRLDIKRTPSFVSQDGLRMKVDEVAL